MIDPHFGDMARHRAFQRHASGLKQTISEHSSELTKGVVSDKTRHLGGEFALLAGVTKSLDLASARQRIARDAQLFLEVQQRAVNDIQNIVQQGARDLRILDNNDYSTSLTFGTNTMVAGLDQVVGRLNTMFGGRSVMAGVASDAPAVVPSEALLDALVADLPAGASAQAVHDHVVQWFAPGGGFDNAGYLGSAAPQARLDLGPGKSASLDVTAQDPALRGALAAFATGAMLSRGVLADDPVAQRALLARASGDLIQSDIALISLAARLGAEEALVAEAGSRAAAEHAAMEIARAELIEADPFEAATLLERAISQLEMIYSLTARLSRLSLAEYLR